jgi:hypothetical protein
VKPLWPRPVFDSRRGSATSTAPILKTGKLCADRLDAAETRKQSHQRIRREAEDLEVQILRRQSQQPIATEAAHDERMTAGRARRCGDVVRELEWWTRAHST